MYPSHRTRAFLLGLSCFCAPAYVLAAPQTVYVLDLNANGSVTSGPASARSSFLAQLLPGAKAETFEQFEPLTTAPLSGNGFGLSLDVNATGPRIVSSTTGSSGRFNTTPNSDPSCKLISDVATCSQWWQSSFSFTITFDQARSAFGFYGTDFGDFGGSLSVYATAVGASSDSLIRTLTFEDQQREGALTFFGFYDRMSSYSRVRLVIDQPDSQEGRDVLGFDDLIIGDVARGTPNPAPEPGTLALAGLSLLGLAAARRRRLG